MMLTDALLERIRRDVKKTGIERHRMSDPLQPGLRVQVYYEGQVSFIVEYKLPGIKSRPHLTIGHWPDMSIQEARKLAVIIRDLGNKGIDVQEGLHDRLLQELKRDGTKWRPALSTRPT
jgi:hypothetical protein